MILQPGARLGPYEIVGLLGAGGMGEVYRARDTRLDRTVAIKILPASFAADPVFRERFDREARTISSLDHPHICVLYDVGRQDGVDFLVMQFLDGETLAARLARGPLPAGQAIEYAAQIAAALDRAHRAGIVHRDLKPGNVMLTRTGGSSSAAVKLLDFGLAKAAPIGGGLAGGLPTMTTPLTGQGTIVGTLQYMAPEQIEGREVDARSDIFALGAMLYESLTGRRAFDAASQAGVMAAILDKEPPAVSSIQPLAPPAVDRIVQRCLAKEPDARWQSASDLAAALAWVRADSGTTSVPPSVPRAVRGWPMAAMAVLLVLSVAAIAGAAWWGMRPAAARARPIHAVLMAPPMNEAVPELSPDGSMVLWTQAEADPNVSPLWLQPLDSDAGRAIPGTEGAVFAFWSPDSRNIAFFADQKLKRVAVSGGAPATICDVVETEARGGTWNSDGLIVFSPGRIGGLWRVAASGGSPVPVTTPDKTAGHTTHRWPHFLPDGRHFLYFASKNSGDEANDAIVFASLDGRESTVIEHAKSNAVFADGRLLFVKNGRLVTRRFDPGSGTLSGDPVPVLDGVTVGYGVTRALFSAVGSTLIAAPDELLRRRSSFSWISRDGSTSLALEENRYRGYAWLSPDGARLVAGIWDPRSQRSDVWTIDVASGARSRVSFDAPAATPVWSSDGARIYYLQFRETATALASKALHGGEEVVVTRALPASAYLQDCSADYCVISAWRPEAGTNFDLLSVRLSDGAVAPAAATPADEDDASLSPDGRLLAYTLLQAGQEDVFVRTFPGGAGLWQVSNGGGQMPMWSRDGRELYYLTDTSLVAVPVTASGGFAAGPPRVVMRRTLDDPAATRILHAQVAADGRILAEVASSSSAPVPYRLVLNWAR